jgi:hypothetical protein
VSPIVHVAVPTDVAALALGVGVAAAVAAAVAVAATAVVGVALGAAAPPHAARKMLADASGAAKRDRYLEIIESSAVWFVRPYTPRGPFALRIL